MLDTALISRGSAILSPCGRYRYRLERRVGAGERIALFVMLNPSTADAEQDDPTIRRCMGFARSFGCGRLVVVNLFAFRATSPRDMLAAADPIGEDNNHRIQVEAMQAAANGVVICAWGSHGKFRDRDRAVMTGLSAPLIGNPMCLALTADGMPRHPLYLRSDRVPQPYAGRL